MKYLVILKNNPNLERSTLHFLIIKFIDALPLKLKKGVKFGYVKTKTLYFVLTHPVYKMEFEYNKADIKSLLKFQDSKCWRYSFFVTNVIEKRGKKKKNLYILKRSYGIFENKAKDEKIFKNLKK